MSECKGAKFFDDSFGIYAERMWIDSEASYNAIKLGALKYGKWNANGMCIVKCTCCIIYLTGSR